MKAFALLHGESAPRKQAERTDRKITEVSDELRSKLVRLDQKMGATLDTVEVTESRIRHSPARVRKLHLAIDLLPPRVAVPLHACNSE